ncbi:hypothetical protein CYY_007513 [Polysphondylium violaceum]|uniref:Uncharacterized protein n=1 Tax=Polysphondylium violaceum TaxID=133409 RepID=A0A8J4UXZ3_9MYCE|nr:hypothetical protein CYY_007513 [Polysphondylium violaceum]
MKNKKKPLTLETQNLNTPKQLEYLQLLEKNQLLSLKKLCFLFISKYYYEKVPVIPTSNSNSSSNGSLSSSGTFGNSNLNAYIDYNFTNSNGSNINNNEGIMIKNLSNELKQELIHFMLEHRLFHSTNKLLQLFQFLGIIDYRIKSLDFSVVKIKSNLSNDPTKDFLKICFGVQNLDLSYCYEASDSILKVLIANISNSHHHQHHHNLQSPQSSSNPSSASSSPVTTPSGNSLLSPTSSLSAMTISDDHEQNPVSPKKSNNPMSLLKNKILKKRKQELSEQSPVTTPTTPANPPISFDNIDITTTTIDDSSSSHTTTSNTITADEASVLSKSLLSSSSSSITSHQYAGLYFLSLRQCTSFSDSVMRKLFKISPNLTYLDITACKIHPKTLQVITTTCAKLRTFILGSININLTPQLAQSFSNLPFLSTLDISHLPKLTDNILESILSTSSPLSTSGGGSKIFSTSSSLRSSGTIFQPSPSIQSLSSISSAHHLNNSLNSTNTTATTHSSSNLSSLDMANVYPGSLTNINLTHTDVEDESLNTLSKKCPNLQELDVSFCTKITNQGFADLATNLVNLTSISARVVKVSSSIIDMVQSNLGISKLDLRFTKVDESHLKEFTCLSNLKFLRLDGTPITDSIFKEIAQKNKKLETVGLSQCKNIKFEIFSTLAEYCPLLKKLFISHCRLVSSSSNPNTASTATTASNSSGNNYIENITKFFNQCCKLSVLDIAFTPMVNDEILEIMTSSKCAINIKSLFIGGGFQVLNTKTIRNIVDACPCMRVFSCISSYNIKDEEILYALKKWLSLEALELTDCTSISAKTLNYVIGENDSHIHLHLRFIFFSSSIISLNANGEIVGNNIVTNPSTPLANVNDIQTSIISKIDGKTSIEIFEMMQEITLENIIDQNWLIL